METENKDLAKALDGLYNGAIKDELVKQGLLHDGNVLKDECKAIDIILLIREIAITSTKIGIEPNFRDLNIFWVNETPYANISIFSAKHNNGTTTINASIILAALILNDIDLVINKNKEPYLSREFIRVIPGYLEALDKKHNTETNAGRYDKKYKTYLMLDEATGYYKIGRAINPTYREATLQSEKPSITLISMCNTDIENILHKRYEAKRMRGEWFHLSKNEVDEIVSLFIDQN